MLIWRMYRVEIMGMNEIAQESTKSKQDRVETCRTHIPTGPEEAGIEIAVGFKGEKKNVLCFHEAHLPEQMQWWPTHTETQAGTRQQISPNRSTVNPWTMEDHLYAGVFQYIQSALPNCGFCISRLNQPRGRGAGTRQHFHMIKCRLPSLDRKYCFHLAVGWIHRCERLIVEDWSWGPQCRVKSYAWIFPWVGIGTPNLALFKSQLYFQTIKTENTIAFALLPGPLKQIYLEVGRTNKH